ncbi:MAG: hypothetical protein AAGJ46_14760 [Planctomycetota bacterium]
MKTLLWIPAVFAALAPLSALAAAAPERIALFRPSDGNTPVWGVSTRPDNDPNVWQDGLLVNDPTNVQFYGFFGTDGFFEDFNGDGLDDKVLVQTAPTVNDFTGFQVIVSFSGEDDISGTANDLIVPGAGGDWGFVGPDKEVLFGDIDGDNISDFGVTAPGASVFIDNTDPAVMDSLQWGMWQSQDVAGVPQNNGSNFTSWSAFGQISEGDVGLLADVNGDGVDDRVLHRPDAQTVFVDFSDPAGGWGDSGADDQVAVGAIGDTVAFSDINGDGFDDLVLIRENPTEDLFDLFGYYTNPNPGAGESYFDTSNPDIQSQFGDLTNDPGWLSPDKILFAQLDLPVDSGVLGDFNNDGEVNAADYTVFRDNLGGNTALPNDDGLGTPIAIGHYNLWSDNFGATTPPAAQAAPEPTTVVLCLLPLAAAALRRRG